MIAIHRNFAALRLADFARQLERELQAAELVRVALGAATQQEALEIAEGIRAENERLRDSQTFLRHLLAGILRQTGVPLELDRLHTKLAPLNPEILTHTNEAGNLVVNVREARLLTPDTTLK